VVLFLSNVVFHWTDIHFLYVAPILLAISCAVLFVVSKATDRGAAGPGSTLVWTPAFFRAESDVLRREPLWRNYRAQAVALLTVTAVIVYIFR
jgi:SSS family solute:Na+ symporter